MFTLLIAIIFLGILIIGHEFGHFAAAKLFKLRVDEFGLGFPPRIFKKKSGETLYSLNAIPFGGFVKIYGEDPREITGDNQRSFQNLSAGKKSLILVSGVLMNIIIGWLAISAVFMIGVEPAVFIGNVANGSPAEMAGLKSEDKLVDFKDSTEFISFVDANRGNDIILNVTRGAENLAVNITPRVSPPPGEGALGISLIDGGISRHGLFGALYEGAKTSVNILLLIFTSLFNLVQSLFVGRWEAAGAVTGPIGIFNVIGVANKLGIVYLLQILGLISLNLAAINIIPFPALDGGRLFFIIYEKISGGRLNLKFEAAIHTAGFVILLLLILAVTVKDIINLT